MKSRAWADIALALVAGAIAAYGFPPHGIGPLTLAAIAVLALRLPDASPRRAAFLVWLFQTAWHFTALAWISEAFLVTMPGMGRWALAPELGLGAGLALFWAAMAYLWRRFWPDAARAGAAAFLGLACALSLGEWLTGHLLTGFPWAQTSLAFLDSPLALNGRSLGAYGVGLTLLAATLAVAGGACAMWRAKMLARRQIAIVAVALAALAAPWSMSVPTRSSVTQGKVLPDQSAWPVIRLVQGNTPQREKWRPENLPTIFARHMKLSMAPAERPLAAIVWPETATPFPVDEAQDALAALAEAAPKDGYVILGAPLRKRQQNGGYRYTNSLIAIDKSGAVVAQYDKAHLVPGGEYVPLENVLPIGKLAPGRGSFVPGPGIATLHLPGLPPFSPLICYEVIFPGAVALDDDRPAFLLNITNDAWYGASAGPYQHLAIARMRAIEEGLPLLRAANTGISAAFDADGRELGRIPLGQTGFLDIALPPPAPPTLYAEYGDTGYFGLLALFAALALTLSRRRRLEA